MVYYRRFTFVRFTHGKTCGTLHLCQLYLNKAYFAHSYPILSDYCLCSQHDIAGKLQDAEKKKKKTAVIVRCRWLCIDSSL